MMYIKYKNLLLCVSFLVLFILNIGSDLPISKQVKQNILGKKYDINCQFFSHCVSNHSENNDGVKMIQLKK